jgi:integrase/recombinase XerD
VLRKKRRHPDLRRAWDLPENALAQALAAFLDWSAAKGFAATTLRQRQRACRRFILWAADRAVDRPQEVTLAVLERYARHLHHYRRPNGRPLSIDFQVQELLPLRTFFRWCARERLVLYNPAAELELPKRPKHLPRHVLSIAEVEAVIAQTDPTTPNGLRDRAMLEVLYSSAIRRRELTQLAVTDVDTRRGSLFVREGKGAKDRLVPLGARACAWVERYLAEARPELLDTEDERALFLTDWGSPFHPDTLGDIVKSYLEAAGITVPGACHLFRHACATHMLEAGADIRFIQALLGHTDLNSTQIYTQVSLAKLKAIHDATHPARLERTTGHEGAAQAPSEDAMRTRLLRTLAAESDDER